MRKKAIKILHMLGVTIVLVLLWAFGIVDVPRLLIEWAEKIQSWGILPLSAALLLAYVIKGRFTLFPSFGVITVNCALLPLWFGIPFAITAHTLGQAICWYWGPASHCKGGKGVLTKLTLEKKWHIMITYFLIPQTDVALLELRTRDHISGPMALLCGLPFIILADVIIVASGKGLLLFLQTLIAQ